MKAVILAAGEGSRMRPLTNNRPKVMLPVAGKPIIEHLLVNLIKADCKEFIFVVGYRSERVKHYFYDGLPWGVHIDYCHQPEAVGTADAVERLKDMVGDRFLVVNGDSIFTPQDLKEFLDKPDAKMGVAKVSDSLGLGVIETNGRSITRIHEKTDSPPTNLANAGLYSFTSDIFKAINMLPPSIRGEYELPDAIQKLIDNGFDFGWNEISSWLTYTYPWDLLNPDGRMLENLEYEIQGIIENNAILKGDVAVGAGTIIRSGSYIVGPAVIGENCDIGPSSYIRPFTSIGNGCHIGTCVEIKNSIIMDNSRVPHFTYIGDSVIGEECNFGAGTQIANLRFDQQNIEVNGKDTKRRKLGSIIGDNVKTGINASINAGTVICNDTIIGPGVLASGYYPPSSRVFR